MSETLAVVENHLRTAVEPWSGPGTYDPVKVLVVDISGHLLVHIPVQRFRDWCGEAPSVRESKFRSLLTEYVNNERDMLQSYKPHGVIEIRNWAVGWVFVNDLTIAAEISPVSFEANEDLRVEDL